MMRSIDELCRGDILLLPYYGEVKVIRLFFDPAHNRQFITLLLLWNEKQLRLTCTRNMCFEYVRFDLS